MIKAVKATRTNELLEKYAKHGAVNDLQTLLYAFTRDIMRRGKPFRNDQARMTNPPWQL